MLFKNQKQSQQNRFTPKFPQAKCATHLFVILFLVIDWHDRGIMTCQNIAQQLQRLGQGRSRAKVRWGQIHLHHSE